MVIAVIIISFILDSIISNFISLNSLFMPLFTLMSLIIIYPYFNGNIKRYFITCFVTGLCYDLIYTDTIIIHAVLFLIIGFIIVKLNQFFSNNYLNVMVMAVICIIIYRFMAYNLLLITANVSFNVLALVKSIYQSLILNLIYIVLLFMITDQISFKFKIKKSD